MVFSPSAWPHVLLSRCLVVLLSALSSACFVGPKMVPPAQFDYNEAVATSWNEQLLLNLVRIHYRDTPVFLEFDQVVAGYTFQRDASAGLTVVPGNAPAVTNSNASVRGSLVERPTVTFSPLQGKEFTSRLLTPIAPETLLLLTESGWNVERVLLCCVHQINSLRNLPSTLDAGLLPPGTFPEFRSLATELGALQRSDGLGIQVTVDANGRTNVAFGGQGGRLIQERLGLGTSPTEVLVTPSRAKPKPGEIKVTARSFLGVLTFLSRYVEPPMSHRDSGLVVSCAEETRQLAGPLFRIRSSTSRPNDAFAAIRYRDHWFSVADADLKSKETFGLITRLFSLQASGSEGRSPLLTIPTG